MKFRLLIVGLMSGSLYAAQPGLQLELKDAEGGMDVRASRQAALYVPANTPASPFIQAGAFTAVFTGTLHLEARSRLYFSFEGRGSAKLTVNDEVLLEVSGEDLSVQTSERERINPGAIPIKVEYTSPEAGDAQFRLFWEERTFAREPVPHAVFSHETDERFDRQSALRQGRVLFAQHQCIKCHQPTEGGFDPQQVMPELMETGPDFHAIGNRLKPGWMTRWIHSPKSLRPTARMPELGLTEAESQDIAAYLASIRPPHSPRHVTGDLKAGEAMFNELGCIACHQLDPEEPFERDVPPIPLQQVTAKYTNISGFLQAPAKHYPSIRMPDFKLTQEEADTLAHFLQWIKAPTDPGVLGDPVKGQVLLQTRGCLNCHQYELENRYVSPSFETIAKTDWTESGCLSEQPSVHLNMRADEKKVLQGFQSHLDSLKQRNAGAYSQRQIAQLNCAACHSRDGQVSQWDHIQESGYGSEPAEKTADETAEDTQHILAKIPTLDQPGEKLKQDWTRDLFAGKHVYRPRGWLSKRMPAFASRAELLAKGLAEAAGVHDTPADAAKDPELTKTGEALAGATGFACVACHGSQDTNPLAVFEGQGINFAYIVPRLREEYYHQWMLDPQRIDPTTIMPKYVVEDGMTTLPDVLGGSASNQFNAIWRYLDAVQGDQVYQSK